MQLRPGAAEQNPGARDERHSSQAGQRARHRHPPDALAEELRCRATRIPIRTDPFHPTETNVFRDVDAWGAVAVGSEVPHVAGAGAVGMDPARYYYAADGALRAIKTYSRRWDSNTGAETASADLIQELRYDALGRRVIQHTRHKPRCSEACHHAIERYVWDGDQLLYELRADGTDGASLEAQWGWGRQHGRTGYVHGPDIDAPLAVMRSNFESSLPIRIVPYTNWRSQYEQGKFAGGWPGCTGRNGPSCVSVDWPAPKLRTFYDGYPRPRGDWVGSLIHDQRDQSGLLYRRNRYYDPNTGQFTQEDPIGLAGGLNLYACAQRRRALPSRRAIGSEFPRGQDPRRERHQGPCGLRRFRIAMRVCRPAEAQVAPPLTFR